jgi:rhamnose utilization protein RhaD (predicted bifunctional aldolase and dehydrogenase)
MYDELLTKDFCSLSAQLGRDPLQVQGPGGNTSIKGEEVMWIKASGKELADAETKNIFVAVDLDAARAEIFGKGDGNCQAAVIDPEQKLRPSIETTFHAILPWPVVVHTHSVAAIVHAISPQGRAAAAEKLSGLAFAFVPYRKPGLPLTAEIIASINSETQVIMLQNHGLICCGQNVQEVAELIAAVEGRLALGVADMVAAPCETPPEGTRWAANVTRLGTDPRLFDLARAGSYYPDHVVFLGPALPLATKFEDRPAMLVERKGVLVKTDATPVQISMLDCLGAVLLRLPENWQAEPIGRQAEEELLNWDAEKYRMSLARPG